MDDKDIVGILVTILMIVCVSWLVWFEGSWVKHEENGSVVINDVLIEYETYYCVRNVIALDGVTINGADLGVLTGDDEMVGPLSCRMFEQVLEWGEAK